MHLFANHRSSGIRRVALGVLVVVPLALISGCASSDLIVDSSANGQQRTPGSTVPTRPEVSSTVPQTTSTPKDPGPTTVPNTGPAVDVEALRPEATKNLELRGLAGSEAKCVIDDLRTNLDEKELSYAIRILSLPEVTEEKVQEIIKISGVDIENSPTLPDEISFAVDRCRETPVTEAPVKK